MPKRLTQKEFQDRVLQKLGSSYIVLGEYKNKEIKIEILHYKCGNKFLKRPGDIMTKGSGCPYCNGNQKAKYTESWVIQNTPYPYKYIKGYNAMKKKCIFYCEKCQTYFEQFPSRLINQKIYGCNCYSTKRKTHEQFLNQLGKECLEEFDILDKYINIDTKIRFKHKQCNTIFKLSPYQFITRHQKKYCPICYYRKSKGQLKVEQFLVANNIDFQKEFTFSDLPNKRFDFFLPKFNTIIQYDGQQHFYPINFFGGKNQFLKQQQSEKIKNEYCLKNKINLFKILYQIYKEKSSTTIEKYLVTKQSTLQVNGNGNG